MTYPRLVVDELPRPRHGTESDPWINWSPERRWASLCEGDWVFYPLGVGCCEEDRIRMNDWYGTGSQASFFRIGHKRDTQGGEKGFLTLEQEHRPHPLPRA